MREFDFQIEKNIPITETRDPRAKQKKYPFAEMKKGDSFSIGVVNGSKGDSDVAMRGLANAARNWKNKTGRHKWKFSCRKAEDNSIRIWRIA